MSPAGGKKQEDNPRQDSKVFAESFVESESPEFQGGESAEQTALSYVENFDEPENSELQRVAGAEQTALYQNSYHKAVDKGILPLVPLASRWIFLTVVGVVWCFIVGVAFLVVAYVSQIYFGEWMTEGQKQILTDCLASIKVFLLGAVASPLVRKFIKF